MSHLVYWCDGLAVMVVPRFVKEPQLNKNEWDTLKLRPATSSNLHLCLAGLVSLLFEGLTAVCP